MRVIFAVQDEEGAMEALGKTLGEGADLSAWVYGETREGPGGAGYHLFRNLVTDEPILIPVARGR